MGTAVRLISTRLGQQVALALWTIGAIKDRTKSPEGNGFRLKLHEKNPDVPLSPIYVDLRLIKSFPDVMHLVVSIYQEMLKALRFNCIADIPQAATAIVAQLAHRLNVPMITPRTDSKTHGSGAKIDGVFQEGDVVALVDDLITRADSKVQAVDALKAAKLSVQDVIVLVDREQGGGEELALANLNLHAAFTLRELLDFYYGQGLMAEAMYQEVMLYLQPPATVTIVTPKVEEPPKRSRDAIFVALDCGKIEALHIARQVAGHPAVAGFKINRSVDQELFSKDEERLFDVLAGLGKPVWCDLKFMDVSRTVAGRIKPYAESGMVQYLTVMAKGGIDMMMDAVEAAGSKTEIIAVTELTSLDEDDIHLGSGQPAKASVRNLARWAVLSGVRNLVCSGLELEAIGARRELKGLRTFVPAISPVWSLKAGADQKRVVTPEAALKGKAFKLIIGGVIVNAESPLEAVEKTAAEIDAIPAQEGGS